METMICEISFGVETFIGQILALLTFFAFPAIQYIVLKRFSRKEGKPELWYLPSYGFRLVIRNIPNKRTLSEIRNRTRIRQAIASNKGSSVATLQDKILIDNEDFFLLPRYDQILINFKITGENENNLKFVYTDKIGNTIEEYDFKEFDQIISDYTANIENFLNFDVKIAKRIIFEKEDLLEYWVSVYKNNVEQRMECKNIIDIG
jgi:hypothetical protein